MKRAPLVLLGACVLGAPAMVFAQSAQDKADAEVLFNAAKTALAAGNLADACPKFAESQRKDPAIGTALYLAECYERSGKIASAWAQFRVAEDMANQRHDNRAGLAKLRAEKLSPSKITIVLSPEAKDVSGLEVKRDGEVVGGASYGLASPVDGGHHAIIATAPGRRAFEWGGDVPQQGGAITVTIPKLEEQHGTTPVATGTTTAPIPTVTATATATPTTTTTAPPPDTSGGMSGVKIAGIVVGAVGLAGIGGSIIMGAVAKSDYGSVLDTVPGHTCKDGSSSPIQCGNQSDTNTANNAVTLANAGTVVFISGCVLAVGGIVMFLAAPKKQKTTAAFTFTPLVSPQGGGALFSGAF